MTTKTIYISNDGAEFDNEQDCIDREKQMSIVAEILENEQIPEDILNSLKCLKLFCDKQDKCGNCILTDICDEEACIAKLKPWNYNSKNTIPKNNIKLKPWVKSGSQYYCPNCWNSFYNKQSKCPKCEEELDMFQEFILESCASYEEEDHARPICIGVREPEECTCYGDRLACPTYKAVRENAKNSVIKGLETI